MKQLITLIWLCCLTFLLSFSAFALDGGVTNLLSNTNVSKEVLAVANQVVDSTNSIQKVQHQPNKAQNQNNEDTIIIDDSLINGTSQGLQYGGSFSSEGYKPEKDLNHIFYEVPTVSEGYLEFQIKGMTNQSGKPEGDVGFCGMYDGRGHEEPIPYFDKFKNNFFRWNVHWRAERDAIKSVILAANPTEEKTECYSGSIFRR